MRNAIDRMSSHGVWTPGTAEFLRHPATMEWLIRLQTETGKSDDEAILILLAALRFLDLTILDGPVDPARLVGVLADHEELRELARTRRVQANVAQRAWPVLELLGRRWGQAPLFVVELGCSFGLIGRVLVNAERILDRFERYFPPAQQRPAAVASVVGYHGLDLAIPDERWLLACIPMGDLRARTARLIAEIPPGPDCTVAVGSALDGPWPLPPPGVRPVVLTSFMLYQLPPEPRSALTGRIVEYTRAHRGSWVNLDLASEGGKMRFFIEQDGTEVMELGNDLCAAWTFHDR